MQAAISESALSGLSPDSLALWVLCEAGKAFGISDMGKIGWQGWLKTGVPTYIVWFKPGFFVIKLWTQNRTIHDKMNS